MLGYKCKVINENYSNPLNRCSAFIVFKKNKKRENLPNFVDPINKNNLKEKIIIYTTRATGIYI